MEHVINAFLKSVQEHANEPAVSDEHSTFTYRELLDFAKCVAANLQKNGIHYGSRVIIEIPRCKEYAGCMIGCWIMGAVAIPLSDDYPPERLEYIKKDSCYELSIDESFLREMDMSLSVEPVVSEMDAEGIVIYTSGSTGNPKGVVHDIYSMSAVATRNAAHDQADKTERNNVVGLIAPFTFVVGTGLMLAAISLAKHLVIVPDEIRKDPYKLAQYYDDNNIESSFVPPRMVDFMLKHNHSLKVISVGSERITGIFYDNNPVVINGYGSTELFGGTLAFQIDKCYENTPIGKPFGTEKVYVLDENNNEVEIGELCISGYVAKGYLNRPEETKRAFIRNPFIERDGFERLFRTGDIVQRLPDGNLIFIERKDWMIKINGQRVEPLEVESTVRIFPGIKEAVVKDFTAKNGITYLAVYYTGDETIKAEDLKEYCKTKLTSYMVPSFYIRMEKLPLNPNGKLDRKNLPEPDISAFKREYAAPENSIEAAVCDAIEKVLGCGKVGRNDDFFLLGGDSIKAIETINELEDLPVDMELFFEGKTPAEIAKRIENGGAEDIPFERVKKDAYPLTDSQLGIYFAMEAAPDSLMYNNPIGIRLGEGVDADRLASAVEQAVSNHKAYHCRIDVVGGLPCMIPADTVFTVQRCGVTDIPAALEAFVQPFDLSSGELIRACIFEHGSERCLALDAHHIVFDGTSLSVLLKEISRIYDGRSIFEERTSAFDLSLYEEALKASDKYAEAKAYYQKRFDGLDISNDFPTDYADTGLATLDSVDIPLLLDREEIDKFLKSNNLTENSLLLSAFAFVLAKYNGTDRSIVCVGESGRHSSMTFNTAGMLVKTIALPVDFTGESDICRYIETLQNAFRDSVRHDSYPFSELSAKYGITNDFSFVYQNDAFSTLTLSGEAFAVEGIRNPHAMNKLTLMAFRKDDGYRLSFRYRSDLYQRGIIEAFADAYVCAVTGFMREEYLKDVNLVSSSQKEVLNSFNGRELPLPDITILESFNAWVSKTPDNDLVVSQGRRYTYREGGIITDRIAAHIQSFGLGRNDVAAILIPRNEWLVLATYGVLKAGCAYQPLDSSYPEDRLIFMVKNAGAKLLITTRELRGKLTGYDGNVLFAEDVEHLPQAVPALVRNDPDDLLALLYTSGTTGTPKGVMLTHGNLLSLAELNRVRYGIGPDAIDACYASYGFDACMQDIICFPCNGGTLHVIPEEIRLDLASLERYIIDNKVTHFVMTTQVGRQFAQVTKSPYLKYIAVGGEALVPLDTSAFSFELINMYGPTECAVYVTSTKVNGTPLRYPIGTVNDNLRAYIVDKNGMRLPVGAPGELLIAGRQVGKGYLGLPDKTAESFIDDPFAEGEVCTRTYRTGDVVRFLPNGMLDFIGRHDGQVKVRGFRVELPEIEEIIRRFNGIKDATVAAFDDPAGGKFIAAYVVSDSTVDIDRLNEFIRTEKPPYMVPAVTMQIDSIPLNQNQKVNKRALPKPERKESVVIAPANATEEAVHAVITKVIGMDKISTDTDFFDAGLTSIAMIRLNVELEKAFDLPFRVSDVTANSTVQKLAHFIETRETVAKYGRLDDYPITQTQMGVYIECMMDPASVLYNIPLLLKLGDGVDVVRLSEAVKTAINAHPYVKSTLFADADGNIRAKRNDDAAQVSLVRCENLPETETLVKPFSLLGGTLYRAEVYETDTGKYLFLDFHHIISDGTSENILLRDINKAYAGLDVEAESFSGYEAALDEQRLRDTEKYAEARAYYDSVFRGCEAVCLPMKSAVSGATGSAASQRFADVNADKIRTFCTENKVTPNAFFNAAFAYTLSRFGKFEDTVYTTIYNGRSDSRLAGSMAMLVKTLPVLLHTSGNRIVLDLIREAQEQIMQNMANDIFSFAEISAAYDIKADIIFAYQGDEFTFDSIAGEPVQLISTGPADAKAPITLNVYLKNGRYQFVLDYSLDRFRAEFIEIFLDTFELVLNAFTQKEKTCFISLLSDKTEAMLDGFNNTEIPFENVSYDCLFRRWVENAPDRIALTCEGRTMTYAELDAAANRAANRLIAAGIGKDSVVGMLLQRSELLSVMELAILKAGGAFLGLLPEYPDDRIDYCLRDAGSTIVITDEELKTTRNALFTEEAPYHAVTASELLAEGNDADPGLLITPDSLAYCIYTSGSTGRPKGVMIEHHNLANLCQPGDSVYRYYFGKDSGHVSIAMSSVSFDMSILENIIMLANGKTVCIATEREIHNPALLADAIIQSGTDILIATPSLLTNLLSIPEFRPAMARLKNIAVGAEAFPPSLYATLKELSPDVTILNAYGPTECTITCCGKKLDSGEGITIGGPIYNTKFFVLDEFGNVLPPYACGELIIAGEPVGRGYMNLPEKTSESFFTLRGLPAYHSGDMVRLNAEGEIEFFGRCDNQVKLRGFRVELDEIEKCMISFEGITQCKVIVRNNGSEDYLAGFYTADRTIDPDALTAHLKAHLTYYMVPDVLMQLDAMPVTPSGKIDKKALPAIKREKKTSGRRAPRKSLEQELCEIFAKVLSLDEFYADDNFFEMGGTSLSASKITMQLMSKGYKVEYQDIFENPTPELLADYIAGQTGAHPAESDAGSRLDDDFEIQSDYPEQLQYNMLEYADQVKREPLGDVLLTGAVGFLGIHVLRELIENETGNIICLIRRTSNYSAEKRLKSMLFYYFDDLMEEALKTRVRVIEADITDNNIVDELKGIHVDTIINCAACVKHYAADDILERINVHGVENLIEVAKDKNAKMIQISTISIPGVHTEETWKRRIKAYENKLFVINDMGNKYGISKYHAELKLLEAVKNGLRGKILRVGNLMGRHSDGEFQINFNTNAFLNAIRGFATIGKSPISHATDPLSLSPIDMTAKAIVLLSGTNDIFTAFNVDNRFIIDEWQLIAAANRCGVKIKPVPDEEYYDDYHRMLGDPSINSRLQGLLTNDRPDLHGVETDNKFTANVLYRLGFSWPLPSDAYLERVIRSLMTMNYFQGEEI